MRKYFLFGDTHGEFDALIESLAAKGFDESNENHILFSVGDLFDRGYQNVKIYEYLQKFLDLDRLYMVLGNHDQIFLDFLYRNFEFYDFNVEHNGLFQTVCDFANLSFSHSREKIQNSYLFVYDEIQKNFPRLKSFMTKMINGGFILDNYLITHAGFSLDLDKNAWFPNPWAITPKFIKENLELKTKYKFVFGHWHAWRLRSEFQNISWPSHHPFILKNFVGLDAATNLSRTVNIFEIESDNEPKPFSIHVKLSDLEDYS
jgi:hypothetical protein